jgi:hypothetical protein
LVDRKEFDLYIGRLTLEELATEIARLHGTIRLRPVLETAREAGRLLLEAKALLPHGEWLPWLRRHTGLSPRTAQVYMRVSLAPNTQTTSHLTIDRFLSLIARRPWNDFPVGAAACHSSCRVYRADCRSYPWPGRLSVIATDPPWEDDAAY